MQEYRHKPVLLNEVLQFVNPQPNQNFIDATLGGGGYSLALLERVGPNGKVLSIDLDQEAIINAQNTKQIHGKENWLILHGNFAQIDSLAATHHFPPSHGIVADLGLSSVHLDSAERGFSFQTRADLDMRFDQTSQEPDAKFLLNHWDTKQLTEIFRNYGEEKFAFQIAKKIVEARAESAIKYTTDLYQIIQDSLPKPVKHKAADVARRIFQALRIAVNHELESLEDFLPKAFDLLVPGGRLAVVSFHSLEDRIVKKFFTGLSQGCVCPPDFPQCVCGRNPRGRTLTKKPIIATEQEVQDNSRSKPAKLRVIQKV